MRSKLTVVVFSILLSTLASAGWVDFFNAPANKSLMGPTSGGAATANWRSLVMADFPAPFTLPAGTSAAPSLSFTGAATTGLFSPGANLLGFSSNGSFAGQLSAGQWQFGPAGATGYPTSAPIAVVLQSSNNPQDSLQFEAAGANANRWGYLGMEHNGAADNLTLGLYNNQVIRLLSNGLGGIGTAGGTMSEKWSVTSSDTSVSSTAFANHESAMSVRNFSATAGNNSALYFRDSAQVMSALIGVHDTHTGGGTGHLEGIVNNAGTAAIAFKFLATKQPVFPFFSTAGPLHTDTSGNLTQASVGLTSEVSGILPIANGGTGVSSASTAPWVEVGGDTMTGALQLPAGASGAPSVNFTTATTSGFYAPAVNSLGISTNGTYAGQIDSSQRWHFGGTASFPVDSAVVSAVGANYQIQLYNPNIGTASNRPFVFDWDTAGNGGFTMLPGPGNGNRAFQYQIADDAWGVGGHTSKSKFAVVAMAADGATKNDTTTTNLSNSAASNGIKTTSTTAGAYAQFPFIDNNDNVIGGMAGKIVTQSATVPDLQLDFITDNGGTKTRALSLLKTGQPQFPFFSSAGVIHTDTSGNFTSSLASLTADVTGVLPIANGGTNSSTALNNKRIMVSSGGAIVEAAALTNGQILIGDTGNAPAAATISAGAGISITNGAHSITVAASGTPAANLVTKTSNYTVTSTDNVVLVDTSAGPVTITLIAAATLGSGGSHKIKKITTDTNLVTINRAGSDTIDGDTSVVLSDPYASVELISDGGTKYHVF